MTYCIAHNITSPLGSTSQANFQAVRTGSSALRRHQHRGLPEAFWGALFEENEVEERFSAAFPDAAPDAFTRFEQLALMSICEALPHTSVRLDSDDTLLVLSTTKGNIELLDPTLRPDLPRERVCLSTAAEIIAAQLHHRGTPVVVSNACISGVSALVVASRLLESGRWRHAVVCGCDVQSAFIVSGFQSFKALSDAPCRPFDADRTGLNLGEAAATMVLTTDKQLATSSSWHLAAGVVRNDANHISGPSRTGEGSYLALRDVLAAGHCTPADLAFVNVHGTATAYNDEMEAIALSRAGMEAVPVNALKGVFGHTMGAAGVLESILSMQAVEAGVVLPTRGFSHLGVSHPIAVSTDERPTCGQRFVKMLSGFGGCNAAMLFAYGEQPLSASPTTHRPTLAPLHTVRITPTSVAVDGTPRPVSGEGGALLVALYKSLAIAYPKFYKMDALCRLGFLAAELLMNALAPDERCHLEQTAVMLVGRSGSLLSDTKHQAAIQSSTAFFPSPAVFVYTLPNIVSGEIAIRHHFLGDTTCFMAESKAPEQSALLLDTITHDPQARHLLGGWLECTDEAHFEAELTFYDLRPA